MSRGGEIELAKGRMEEERYGRGIDVDGVVRLHAMGQQCSLFLFMQLSKWAGRCQQLLHLLNVESQVSADGLHAPAPEGVIFDVAKVIMGWCLKARHADMVVSHHNDVERLATLF